MKLFGNSKGAHAPRRDDVPEIKPIRRPQAEPARGPAQPEAARIPWDAPEPEIAAVRVDSAREAAAPKKKKRKVFRAVFLLYVALLLAAIVAGLSLLWQRMEVYELSRPDNEMADFMARTGSAGWREFLLGRGVEESFVGSLQLDAAEYRKRPGAYADDVPVYTVRFGTRDMLTVALDKGEDLGFGSNAWEIGEITLLPSGLCLYAPEGAVISVDGAPLEGDYLTEKNAQPLTLGDFDAARDDVPGLDQYRLDFLFGVSRVTVTDAEGSALPLSQQSGLSFYYAPVTHAWRITAPASVAVTVNGVVLTEENATVATARLEDFDGLEQYLGFTPETRTFTVEGLVSEPEIGVIAPENVVLDRSGEGRSVVYTLKPDAKMLEEQREFLADVFDAYMAFSGNRGGNEEANYRRIAAYVVPRSDLLSRLYQAMESVHWGSNRDQNLVSWEAVELISYADDCYTCLFNYTVRTDETEGANSLLFIFVKYNGDWKLVQALNKTSFL